MPRPKFEFENLRYDMRIWDNNGVHFFGCDVRVSCPICAFQVKLVFVLCLCNETDSSPYTGFRYLILARVAMTGIFVCIHIQTISYHIFQLLYVYSYWRMCRSVFVCAPLPTPILHTTHLNVNNIQRDPPLNAKLSPCLRPKNEVSRQGGCRCQSWRSLIQRSTCTFLNKLRNSCECLYFILRSDCLNDPYPY